MTQITTTQEATSLLESLIPNLQANDADFARALLRSLIKYGITPGRWSAILSLQQRAQSQQPGAPAPQDSVGDFHKVFALMSKAGETLRLPKIRLMLADKSPIVLGIASAASKFPGTINVTDGAGYGNAWYGRVDKQGNFSASGKNAPERTNELRGLLTKLGEAPAKVAAEYGRLTGRCCFCNLPLTDEQSTAAGFGPKCAKNYGLADVRLEALPTLYAAQQSEQA